MKKILTVFALFMVLLSGCSQSDKTTEKTIEVPRFTDLVLKEDKLLPNVDLTWNMSIEEFMEDIYGADMLNPESKNFDSYRYSYSEAQKVTTLEPPILYSISDFPKKAEVGYAFNENGLYMAGYSWIFKAEETEDARKTAASLLDDLTANPYLIRQTAEVPDFSKDEIGDIPYIVTWTLTDSSEQSVELQLLLRKIQNSVAVSVTIIQNQ